MATDPSTTDSSQCIVCGRSVSDHSNPNTDYRGNTGTAPPTDHYFEGGNLNGSDDKPYFTNKRGGFAGYDSSDSPNDVYINAGKTGKIWGKKFESKASEDISFADGVKYRYSVVKNDEDYHETDDLEEAKNEAYLIGGVVLDSKNEWTNVYTAPTYTESKASKDRDWDGRSDLEKLERDQELSQQFWNKSSTLNEIPDSYYKESKASESGLDSYTLRMFNQDGNLRKQMFFRDEQEARNMENQFWERGDDYATDYKVVLYYDNEEISSRQTKDIQETLPRGFESKANEVNIERGDNSMKIDGKNVIKIWESFSGWYWYAIEDQGSYTGVGADGNDVQAHAWYGYVQGMENEWGTWDSNELERAGVWTVPKSNWGWTGKESKASELTDDEFNAYQKKTEDDFMNDPEVGSDNKTNKQRFDTLMASLKAEGIEPPKASETQDDFDWLNEDDDRFTATMWEQSDGSWLVKSEGSQFDSSFTKRFTDSVDANIYMDKVNRGELTKQDLYNDEMNGYRSLESKASEVNYDYNKIEGGSTIEYYGYDGRTGNADGSIKKDKAQLKGPAGWVVGGGNGTIVDERSFISSESKASEKYRIYFKNLTTGEEEDYGTAKNLKDMIVKRDMANDLRANMVDPVEVMVEGDESKASEVISDSDKQILSDWVSQNRDWTTIDDLPNEIFIPLMASFGDDIDKRVEAQVEIIDYMESLGEVNIGAESWNQKSSINKIEALERVGLKQGDAIKLSGLEFDDFGEDLQDALKGDVEDARTQMKQDKHELDGLGDYNPNDSEDAKTTGLGWQVGGEVDNPNSEFDQNYPDYNNIGKSQTNMTNYECEFCDNGFESNESLSIHYNDKHAISPESLDGYERDDGDHDAIEDGKADWDNYGRYESKANESDIMEWITLWDNPEPTTDKLRNFLRSKGYPDNEITDVIEQHNLIEHFGESKASEFNIHGYDWDEKCPNCGSDDIEDTVGQGGASGYHCMSCDEYFDNMDLMEKISNESKASERGRWGCPVCGSRDNRPIPKVRSGGLPSKNRFCNQCGSPFNVDHEYNDEEIKQIADLGNMMMKNTQYDKTGLESKASEDDPDFDNDPDFEGKIDGVSVEPSQYTQSGMDHTDYGRGDIDESKASEYTDEEQKILDHTMEAARMEGFVMDPNAFTTPHTWVQGSGGADDIYCRVCGVSKSVESKANEGMKDKNGNMICHICGSIDTVLDILEREIWEGWEKYESWCCNNCGNCFDGDIVSTDRGSYEESKASEYDTDMNHGEDAEFSLHSWELVSGEAGNGFQCSICGLVEDDIGDEGDRLESSESKASENHYVYGDKSLIANKSTDEYFTFGDGFSTCKVCGEQIEGGHGHYKHLQTHYSEESKASEVCPECNSSKVHINRDKGDSRFGQGKYACNNCGNTFGGESKASEDYEVDVDEYEKTGEPVEKLPIDKRNYDVEAGSEDHVCAECGFVTSDNSEYIDHLHAHEVNHG